MPDDRPIPPLGLPTPAPDVSGGESACWLPSVCPTCGAFNENLPAPCWNCGRDPGDPATTLHPSR